ncbi:ergothioneine biosynthesis protein EgtB [Halopseudomonas nanhaiensis]|uniref:ergothioneine biosynthesis protein EgtB n=1 Tax=Halopseudomonas nanhaiensis TaxID=2830842 RepID=UPI001CC08270|nr:ergothioneine biosynthesis protein EgtB [Halopseudomonas nanhaiensis]UAW97839.1 ergothioneine biosynthesis protein EgtB [Halopseudomonas nanhaiensis]
MSVHDPQLQSDVLAARYDEVRTYTRSLVEGLSEEDCQLQSMIDASPTKWHLAHTTWFFETFILSALEQPPEPFDPAFKVLFNSYYVGVGERHQRAERGLISRPSLSEVLSYRDYVDQRMHTALAGRTMSESLLALVELGLNHEQQHQELILTDQKHHFSCNPLWPAWRRTSADQTTQAGCEQGSQFVRCDGGLVEIGHSADAFCFDNELPRHRVWIDPFDIQTRNVSNGDYLAFMAEGGYNRPELWLSEGWDKVCSLGWQAPLYWRYRDGGWYSFTLHGEQAINHDAPVTHLSYYEAEAYARWAGARLPTEAEWECAATSQLPLSGLFDEVWQWTNSAYLPYPGYQPAAGAVGEYNGKFMINQMVLRGSSLATPAGHARVTYRNFFPADARWQFNGLRLARGL